MEKERIFTGDMWIRNTYNIQQTMAQINIRTPSSGVEEKFWGDILTWDYAV
jgi:hypothetical protein